MRQSWVVLSFVKRRQNRRGRPITKRSASRLVSPTMIDSRGGVEPEMTADDDAIEVT